MSTYKYLTNYNAVSYTSGREGQAIDKIIIHHWGDDGQTFESVCNWFENSNCSTSAHYVAEDGRVACLVDLSNTAYHAGNWGANLTSIGIECRPEMSKGDLETVCQLVADLFATYGKLPIYGHKDFYSTQCPGRYYGQLNYIRKRANEILESGANEQEEEEMQFTEAEAKWLKQLYANSTKTACSDWAEPEFSEAVKAGITTGERPQDKLTRQEGAIMVLRATKSK